MTRTVQIKLTDGTSWTAHQSVVAAAGALSVEEPPTANEIATWVWKRLENPSLEEDPLILIAESGNACVARLNVENVTGVFVWDEDQS